MGTPLNRPGFSLIEALVVLAISGMALAIIFSIGVKAGDSGFALGRRAMSAADQDVSVGDVRSLFRSVSVRPERTFRTAIDQPITGRPDRFEGEIVAERATQCAPSGWSGRLVLTVETRGAVRVLVCRAGGRVTDLLTTTDPAASLSYSRDGRTWAAAFDNTPSSRAFEDVIRSERLYMRFRGGRGMDVVEMASSARPQTWISRFDILQ